MANGKLVGIISLNNIQQASPSVAPGLLEHEPVDALAVLQVASIMRCPVVIAQPNLELGAAARLMLQHKIGALPVLVGDQLAGIITESDLFKILSRDPEIVLLLQRQKVGAWMTSPAITVTADVSLPVLRDCMGEHQIRRVPVVDVHGALIGLVTRSALLAAAPSPLNVLSDEEKARAEARITAQDLMTRPVVTVTADDTISAAAGLMLEMRFGGLPVTEDGSLAGIITESDIFKMMSHKFL